MKIIDLYNMVANNEKLPKKIIYKNCIFENRSVIDYWCKEAKICLDELIFMQNLNDEVEILEEENKIPEKLEEFGLIQYNLDYIDYKNIETLKEWLNKDFQTIYDTIDLIIKNQNKLIDYLKSKGDE